MQNMCGSSADKKARKFRSGIGYDAHRLVAGRRLVLGGVRIPFAKGLLGHSDADVLVHAIMDAILGAAGQGDIGVLFPDTDKKFKGASSLALLKKVAKAVADDGFCVVNVDVTLLAEAPKIGKFRAVMASNIAKALGIDAHRVNVKATTNEGMGFVGTGEGMAAYATASLSKG